MKIRGQATHSSLFLTREGSASSLWIHWISPLIERFVSMALQRRKTGWLSNMLDGRKWYLWSVSLVTIFLSSQYFHSACGMGLWGRRKGVVKDVWRHPTVVEVYRISSCTSYTLIYTRPYYLPVSKEWINMGLRDKRRCRKRKGWSWQAWHLSVPTHDLWPALSASGGCAPDNSEQAACTQLLQLTLLWMRCNCRSCALRNSGGSSREEG